VRALTWCCIHTPPNRALQLAFGLGQTQALYVVMRLGVPDVLAKSGPQTAQVGITAI
jgi:hypothetical protein